MTTSTVPCKRFEHTHTCSVFLLASDIPRFVALESVALGRTGQDAIEESTHADMLNELLPLGFGKCTLQVQVPISGPIQTLDDLSGGVIATSFRVLASGLFDEIDRTLNKTEDDRTKIEYIRGSVEAACALGIADGIGESRHLISYMLMSSSRSCWHVIPLPGLCPSTGETARTRLIFRIG